MDRRGLLNDPIETSLLMLDGRQAQMWTALPCKIISINLVQMTIEAQPLIQGVTYDQNNNATFVNLPVLGDVPVVFPSAGGIFLTLPLTIGDEVLVVFASRCIDAWWQSGGIQMPMEMRMHDLSDGFAIPGPKSLPSVPVSISSTSAQLRTANGASYIELTKTGAINLVSPTVNITGNLVVTGEVTGNGIPLSTHLHGGVTTGGGDTGVPIV